MIEVPVVLVVLLMLIGFVALSFQPPQPPPIIIVQQPGDASFARGNGCGWLLVVCIVALVLAALFVRAAS